MDGLAAGWPNGLAAGWPIGLAAGWPSGRVASWAVWAVWAIKSTAKNPHRVHRVLALPRNYRVKHGFLNFYKRIANSAYLAMLAKAFTAAQIGA